MKKQTKSTTKKGSAIKDWTEPEYLSKEDWEDLKTVKRFYEKGKLKEAMRFASGLDTAVRDEIPPKIWKDMGGELTPSGEAELKKQQGKVEEVDYSDELLDLKWMHEYNQRRTFTNDEFNEIFATALKKNPGLLKQAEKLIEHVVGMLITLEDATTDWEEEKLVKGIKGNPKDEIQGMIKKLEHVIEDYANDKNPNWGTVGSLANIHESLGRQLYRNYHEHLGYSRSVKEGIKRHSAAALDLLLQVSKEIGKLDPKKHLPELARWRQFFSDLLEGFQDILSGTPPEQSQIESLRDEAIELARKLHDEELVKYLQKAPLKAIQRRIRALREEAEEGR